VVTPALGDEAYSIVHFCRIALNDSESLGKPVTGRIVYDLGEDEERLKGALTENVYALWIEPLECVQVQAETPVPRQPGQVLQCVHFATLPGLDRRKDQGMRGIVAEGGAL